MDYLVINEMSVEGQASSPQHGDTLMKEMADALKALEPIRREVLRREDLRNRQLSKNQTVFQWLFGRGPRETKNTRDFLMKVLSKGPFLETLLCNVPHTCYMGDGESRQSVDGSGLAGAVHFGAILLSFAESKQFPRTPVTVWYGENGDQPTPEVLRHVVNEGDVRAVRRWYEPHSKKHHPGNNEDSHHAPMDLKDEIAQLVLDRAVSVPDDNRVVGLHEGRFYVFHRHEKNTYHGFIMAECEVERKFPKHHQFLRNVSASAHSPTRKG